MGRSLGVVVVGWGSGFLLAIAFGATRANNPRLASTLSGWAIVGMAITALLLVSIAVTDRLDRRRAAREPEPEAQTPASDPTQPIVEGNAGALTAVEQRAAARIAELEARLAREQEELDATMASLAATGLAATGHVSAGLVEATEDPRAAELEPVLRQEVVDAVAELVGHSPAETAALAGHLEALLEKAR